MWTAALPPSAADSFPRFPGGYRKARPGGAGPSEGGRRMAVIAPLKVDGLAAEDAGPLAALFAVLAADPETARFFHPHPLTTPYAVQLCGRVATCQDLYFVTRYRS